MSGSLSVNDYTRIYSNDGSQFVIEAKVVPKGFPSKLNYNSPILQTIIQYLYFKHLNAKKPLHKLPAFDIRSEIALEILKAATDLGI